MLPRPPTAALRCSLSAALAHAAAPLTPGQPILLEKTTGKFDFLSIDPARKRLLVAHPGNSSLDVVDLEKKTLLKSIATGAAQSAVADPKGAEYFAGVSKPPQLAIVDAEKLTVTGTVPLGGPADIIALQRQVRSRLCRRTTMARSFGSSIPRKRRSSPPSRSAATLRKISPLTNRARGSSKT